MPTYDYECQACKHQWEEFQSIKAKPTKKCPECGKNKAQRLISGGGAILFKGSVFYITDYRSDSYKQGASADAKSGSESKPADSKPTESKPSDSSSKSASE